MTARQVYIISARRSAIGRLGGLHRQRRIEDLAAPVLAQALVDAQIEPSRVDLFRLGNTAAGGNPARLVGLLACIGDRAMMSTVDRHTASGLDAVIDAIRMIAQREAEIAVAGGAESFSTAPWRLVKPRTLYQLPRFVGVTQSDDSGSGQLPGIEAAEALATHMNIARSQQDEYALTNHIKATLARDARRFAREIVPLKSKADEARDELIGEPDIEDMESIPPYLETGTLTAGNTSLPADGAAFVVAVSERVYQDLGRPPALILKAHAALGVSPGEDGEAPILAVAALRRRHAGLAVAATNVIELGESSAVQAIAFAARTGLAESLVNADGGQIARGEPGAAAGAVLLVRLFSRLVRAEPSSPSSTGLAVIGAAGGQATAAVFERV